jgi:hypothetical protein
MLINREDIFHMKKHEAYIKQRNKFVRIVYCHSIYFVKNEEDLSCCWNFGWLDADEDEALRQINAICNTDFKFKD